MYIIIIIKTLKCIWWHSCVVLCVCVGGGGFFFFFFSSCLAITWLWHDNWQGLCAACCHMALLFAILHLCIFNKKNLSIPFSFLFYYLEFLKLWHWQIRQNCQQYQHVLTMPNSLQLYAQCVQNFKRTVHDQASHTNFCFEIAVYCGWVWQCQLHSVHPEMTQCGWQVIKIQELTN